MKLVEVVSTIATAPDVAATAHAVCAQLGKHAVLLHRPGRVHRQRAAVPVPQRRGEDARGALRDRRRHRRGDEGRLRLPDGPVRAAGRRRPGRLAGDRAGALHRVPRARLRARPRCWSTWSPPATWAARPVAGSATTRAGRRGAPRAATAAAGPGRAAGAPGPVQPVEEAADGDWVVRPLTGAGHRQDLPLPGLRPGDPARDAARGDLAGLRPGLRPRPVGHRVGRRLAPALAHRLLAGPRPPPLAHSQPGGTTTTLSRVAARGSGRSAAAGDQPQLGPGRRARRPPRSRSRSSGTAPPGRRRTRAVVPVGAVDHDLVAGRELLQPEEHRRAAAVVDVPGEHRRPDLARGRAGGEPAGDGEVRRRHERAGGVDADLAPASCPPRSPGWSPGPGRPPPAPPVQQHDRCRRGRRGDGRRRRRRPPGRRSARPPAVTATAASDHRSAVRPRGRGRRCRPPGAVVERGSSRVSAAACRAGRPRRGSRTRTVSSRPARPARPGPAGPRAGRRRPPSRRPGLHAADRDDARARGVQGGGDGQAAAAAVEHQQAVGRAGRQVDRQVGGRPPAGGHLQRRRRRRARRRSRRRVAKSSPGRACGAADRGADGGRRPRAVDQPDPARPAGGRVRSSSRTERPRSAKQPRPATVRRRPAATVDRRRQHRRAVGGGAGRALLTA